MVKTSPYPVFKNSTQTGFYQFEFEKKYKQLLKNLQSSIKTEDFSEIKRAYHSSIRPQPKGFGYNQ